MNRWVIHTATMAADSRQVSTVYETRAPANAANAFTLAEMLVVLVIVSMMAVVAVPRYVRLAQGQRLEAAVRRIKTDLDYARSVARTTSTSITVNYNEANDRYKMNQIDDPDHPGQVYEVMLAEEPYDADLISANFGGSNSVTFDGFGKPDSSGWVIVGVGDVQKTISVEGANVIVITLPPVTGL